MSTEEQDKPLGGGGSMLDPEEKPWRFRSVLGLSFLVYLFFMPPQHELVGKVWGDDKLPLEIGSLFITVSIIYFCIILAFLLWDLFLNTAKLVRHGKSYWQQFWALFVFDIVLIIWMVFLLGSKFGPAPAPPEAEG